MRNCKFLPHPKSLPQGEGLEFDFSSLVDFQHHYSHSLADGARGVGRFLVIAILA